jgi:hypothetical protein
LQLFVSPAGGEEKIFAMGDFTAGLAAAAKKLDAEATENGIRIRMDASILFDSAKSELKPEAREAIQAISEMIRSYPNAVVRVLGFTDAVGDDGFADDRHVLREELAEHACPHAAGVHGQHGPHAHARGQ